MADHQKEDWTIISEYDDEPSCVQYDFVTLLKANNDNLTEHGGRYNAACRWFEKVMDKPSISRLIDLRYQAKRAAMAQQAISMEFSPYSDEGAAIAYGYVEGGMELLMLNMKMAADSRGA